MIELDKWQKDVLNTTGNIALRSGRQVGKSTVISIKAAEFAVQNKKKSIMIISATERQAYLLFSKVLMYLQDYHKKEIKTGRDRPTKSEVKLKNGSVIRCLPTGADGLGIRGYTTDLLIADEAAFIPDDVWAAVTPQLATTGGNIILLSTPFGRRGYFYERFSDPTFSCFHINTLEVAEHRKDPQKSHLTKFVEEERQRMSKLQFQQEYLGEFVSGIGQLFSDTIIKDCQTSARRQSILNGRRYYLGVDVARMGGDESTFEVIDKENDSQYEQVENIISTYQEIPQTTEQVLALEKIYDFKAIGIDTGGMGVAVYDYLRRDDSTKRVVHDLDNSKRALGYGDNESRTTLMKEAMYMNLLHMMQRKELKLLKDDNIFFSLKSVQIEYNENGKLLIYGNNTHIAEGLIRAAWLAVQDKHLNLYLDYLGHGK